MSPAGRDRRSGPRYAWVVVGAVLLALVGLVIRNNLDLFGTEGEETAPAQGQRTEQVYPEPSPSPIHADTAVAPGPAAAEYDGPVIELTDLRCDPVGEEGLSLQVSVRFHLYDEAGREMLLMKRNELRVMVKKVLGSKRLSDMVVDNLRHELVSEASDFVGDGLIRDIEFTDFRPSRK